MAPLLVVGLGNPGARYAATRHNVGFATAFRLADLLRARSFERTAEYEAWRTVLPGAAGSGGAGVAGVGGADLELRIVTPLLFMNRSGEALAAYRGRHGLDPGRMLVVVDDVYLPVGALRLRARGSDGGHNGLASIEAALGTGQYARLRIGVGRGDRDTILADHVLATFDPDEEPVIAEALDRAVEAARLWAVEGITAAMNRFNARTRDERTDTPSGER